MQTDKEKRGFASDNNAGVHPEILQAIISVNKGHAIGYGADIYTEKAIKKFKEYLGSRTEIYFVFNGTAANVLGLSGVTRPWNSIITANTAHIEQDECGAPEKISGCKVLTVDTPDGKITVEMVAKHIHGFDFEHHSQPKIISIAQPTEMGTVYTVDEIKKIADYAHKRKMLLHMDGARIANAAVSLNLPFKSFTTDAGVDVLSFGGTKNGMIYGEAVCFLSPEHSNEFKYIRKQNMQLASKMRFISAQYLGYFNNELWKRNASNANKMASLLAYRVKSIDSLKITQPVQANAVFVIIPPAIVKRLTDRYFFYPWKENISEYRWMTSWDTTESDIDDFTDLLRTIL